MSRSLFTWIQVSSWPLWLIPWTIYAVRLDYILLKLFRDTVNVRMNALQRSSKFNYMFCVSWGKISLWEMKRKEGCFSALKFAVVAKVHKLFQRSSNICHAKYWSAGFPGQCWKCQLQPQLKNHIFVADTDVVKGRDFFNVRVSHYKRVEGDTTQRLARKTCSNTKALWGLLGIY